MRIEYFSRSLQAVLNGEGRLEWSNNIIFSKIASGSVPNKLVQLNCITLGGLGVDPLPFGNLLIFREKNSQFSAIWNKFHTFSKPFKRTKILKCKSYVKGLNLFSSVPLLTGEVQIRDKSKTRWNAMFYLIWLAPPNCVTVLCRQRLCYFRTATLSLHITQLAVLYYWLTQKYCSSRFSLNTRQSESTFLEVI